MKKKDFPIICRIYKMNTTNKRVRNAVLWKDGGLAVGMLIREKLEQWEKEYLSPYASLSMNSRGRSREEEQCDIRPVYQRDRDRILQDRKSVV